MRGLKVTTAPASVPVDAGEIKERLRVSWDDEDDTVNGLIREATAAAESECGRAFITQTLTLYMDRFPYHGGVIRLPRPPAVSVSAVRYYNAAGELTTLSSAAYHAAVNGEPARLFPVGGSGARWPETQRGRPESVEIEYVAGYGDADAVPDLAKAAIAEIVAHRWEHRGDEATLGIPPTARRLLDCLETGEVY